MKTKFINKSNIDWPFPDLYIWPVINGCPRNCFDGKCWAKKFNKRMLGIGKASGKRLLGAVDDFSKPEWSEEIYNHRFPEKAKHIFVAPRSDPQYWEKDHYYKILERIEKNQDINFIFLTKNPDAYVYIYDDLPTNVILGTTINFNLKIEDTCDLFFKSWISKNNNPNSKLFISIEPLLGNIPKDLNVEFFDYIVVGAMNQGPGPKKEWIQSVCDNISEEKIYWKKNIRKYL
jgi:protein gp37